MELVAIRPITLGTTKIDVGTRIDKITSDGTGEVTYSVGGRLINIRDSLPFALNAVKINELPSPGPDKTIVWYSARSGTLMHVDASGDMTPYKKAKSNFFASDVGSVMEKQAPVNGITFDKNEFAMTYTLKDLHGQTIEYIRFTPKPESVCAAKKGSGKRILINTGLVDTWTGLYAVPIEDNIYYIYGANEYHCKWSSGKFVAYSGDLWLTKDVNDLAGHKISANTIVTLDAYDCHKDGCKGVVYIDYNDATSSTIIETQHKISEFSLHNDLLYLQLPLTDKKTTTPTSTTAPTTTSPATSATITAPPVSKPTSQQIISATFPFDEYNALVHENPAVEQLIIMSVNIGANIDLNAVSRLEADARRINTSTFRGELMKRIALSLAKSLREKAGVMRGGVRNSDYEHAKQRANYSVAKLEKSINSIMISKNNNGL